MWVAALDTPFDADGKGRGGVWVAGAPRSENQDVTGKG
jgi:hypothetical protein